MATHDPYRTPPGLPVPVDDGACQHVPGTRVPPLSLPSTTGGIVDLQDAAAGTLVLFIYPRTGKPNIPPPRGWDEIPGARDCTPQACAFRDRYAELRALGADVLGLSAQTLADQQEFARRAHLPYPLLSDPQLALTSALRLPTFEVEGMRLYKRVTLIALRGVIARVFYPVFPPEANADEVLAWLERRSTAELDHGRDILPS